MTPAHAYHRHQDPLLGLVAALLLAACATATPTQEPGKDDGDTGINGPSAIAPGDARPVDPVKPPPKKVVEAPKPKPKPNILLLFVDTLRYDHMSIYGYGRKTTPNLDRWFGDGTIFEWAHATGPATRFSVPPMTFGKHYTEIHRGAGHWPRIKNSEITMGELMQRQGYHTGAVHTIHYFREKFNMHRGWDHWDTSCLQWRNPKSKKNPKWKDVPHRRCEWDRPTADWVTDRMIHHIETAQVDKSDKPFLLWAYYSDPHSPYIRHKDAPKFGPWYHDRYDQEIWYSDHHMGRLLEYMDAKGMLDNTIIVMTSDHGEGLHRHKDHGRLLHSSTLYGNLLRIPMLVGAKPDVRKRYGITARRVKTPVSLLDVLPTFLEAAGVLKDDFPSYFRGVSLWPWIQGKNRRHPPLFFEKHRAEDQPQKAMLDWPFKIIVNIRSAWKWSIYNLATDPDETKNLRYRMDKDLRRQIWTKYKRYEKNTLNSAPFNPLN